MLRTALKLKCGSPLRGRMALGTADSTKGKMRKEVLNAFKRLHRARQFVFQGDERALIAGRKEINEHFRKNKDVEQEEEIQKLVQLAHDVEKELRSNVIQAVQKDEGVFELRITKETTKLDNVSFDPYAIPEPRTPRNRRNRPETDKFECCGGSQTGCHGPDKSSSRK